VTPIDDHVTITIVDSEPRPQPITVAESLERFRTVAFGLEVMKDNISISPIAGLVDATTWFQVILPECYRDPAWPIIEEVFQRHRGKRLTRVSLLVLIHELCGELAARIEPIMPGEQR
jgi:hypothetical protein